MDRYLIYLRKSRADRDIESRDGGDTLARHRAALLDLARRMDLFVAKIYEEVVSGETISARPEMRKLLLEVESGRYAGVLVMEVERLARGNTRDQGMVAETFQYSGARIITPAKIYDPADEADQEYFEFGLFMSRREYKAINRRLQRGREASLKEGKYIAGTAPYGYVRAKIPGQKGYTLEIDPVKAPVVRRIFALYVSGERLSEGSWGNYGADAIAALLNREAIPSPSGGTWTPCTVRDMLRNPTYAGMLRWSYRPTVRRMVGGRRVESRPVNRNPCYSPGLHPPIIEKAIWDAAQAILFGRSHAPLSMSRTLRNPLAGLVFCSLCGHRMERRAEKHGRDTLLCPNTECPCSSSPIEEVEQCVLEALRRWLAGYRMDGVSPPPYDGETALSDLEQAAAGLEARLTELRKRRNHLFDLVEQGAYTPDEFTERSRVLDHRIGAAAQALEKAGLQLQAERELSGRMPEFPSPKNLVDLYPLLSSTDDKNRFFRTVLRRVEYRKTSGGRWKRGDLALSIFPKIV